MDREALRVAVQSRFSIIGVIRALGLPETDTSRQLVRECLALHGLGTSHFTGPAHNRGQKTGPRCRPEQLLSARPPGSRRVPGGRLRAMLVHTGRADVCAECGTPPIWRGQPMTLEVDHINGDWLDNRADNLRRLCPNCHSVTPTYCGRNKKHPSTA